MRPTYFGFHFFDFGSFEIYLFVLHSLPHKALIVIVTNHIGNNKPQQKKVCYSTFHPTNVLDLLGERYLVGILCFRFLFVKTNFRFVR